jgi:hypothetical protein
VLLCVSAEGGGNVAADQASALPPSACSGLPHGRGESSGCVTGKSRCSRSVLSDPLLLRRSLPHRWPLRGVRRTVARVGPPRASRRSLHAGSDARRPARPLAVSHPIKSMSPRTHWPAICLFPGIS